MNQKLSLERYKAEIKKNKVEYNKVVKIFFYYYNENIGASNSFLSMSLISYFISRKFYHQK